MAAAEAPAPGANDSGAESAARFGLIFVPGMGELFIDQSVDGVAIRIAEALNREAATATAQFTVDPEIREETFGHDRKTAACTIVRTDAGAPTTAIDVYRLDGIRALRSPYESSGFLRKAILPALVLWSYVPRARAARKRAAKSRRERRQLDYAIGVLGLLTIYLFAVVVAAAIAAVNALDPNLLDKLIPERAQSIWQGVVLVLTALGLWKSNILSMLASGAVGYVAVAGYLDRGDRRDNVVGELGGLLEYVAEKEPRYKRVDVVAFSFGGITALDAFFREDRQAGPRFANVRTLVTIACPFDFVRSYWGGHFASRLPNPPGPQAWLNVYSPIDVLSSNFRDDSKLDEPSVGIPTGSPDGRKPTKNIPYRSGKSVDDMSRLEFLAFTGLSSHSIYWGRKAESEDTVFRSIVPELYGGELVLG